MNLQKHRSHPNQKKNIQDKKKNLITSQPVHLAVWNFGACVCLLVGYMMRCGYLARLCTKHIKYVTSDANYTSYSFVYINIGIGIGRNLSEHTVPRVCISLRY